MEEKEKQWIKEKFREAYKKIRVHVHYIEKREFGIGTFGKKISKRHIAFKNDDELNTFLRTQVPLYISYSIALYNYPSARPMENKEWLGSELVFDLDGEASKEGIDKVKEDVIKLRDLLKYYFNIKHYIICFSGNRGFHLHVRDKKFLSLDRDDRKRLIDIITGNSFDTHLMFEAYKRFNKELLINNPGIVPGPSPNDGGIPGMLAKEFIKQLEEKPSKFSRALIREGIRSKIIENIKHGNWNPLGKKLDFAKYLSMIIDDISLKFVNVDSGVTYDVSKLIRMPGSLHGSTGLLVMPIKESKLDEFNAFKDAIIIDDDKELVRINESLKLELGEIKGSFHKGEKVKLPSYAAAYLILHEKASLI